MHRRRFAAAALFVALAAAACGGGQTKVAAARDANDAIPPAAGTVASSPSTTTTTTLLAPTPTTAAATDAVDPAARPVNDEPAAPEPASIEVDYQPAADATASATLTGPNGTHSKSLDSGAAIFGELPGGEYSVTVIVDTPSGDPTVGDARQILNGGTITVGPGDHGVITCDDSGCSAVLSE